MASQEPTRKRPTPPGSGSPPQEIPDKLYFRIGEVARLCDLPTYVLRFWEGEFAQLKPNKGGTGQRLYRRRDVDTVLTIKRLLYAEGYTIPGARQILKSELRSTRDAQLALGGIAETIDSRHLIALQKELRDLHSLLSKPAAPRQSPQAIRVSRSVAPGPITSPPAPHPFPRKPTLLQSDSLFTDSD